MLFIILNLIVLVAWNILCIFAVYFYNMERDKLGQTEYEEVLLDNISKLVINRNYILENPDFFDAVIFKMFEDYLFSLEPVSITKQAKMLELFLGCMLKYLPTQSLPEDSLKIY